ncbi:nucleotidyltransferase family protein [Sphaerisporangium aureirubrum]|uniref:Nucleotidyltransferase family protein n=1 Tax=Sphaerisporangium aureirubrum TaxID=1544736 RepID=A0ABW1NTF3_9ACTN
MAGLTSGELEEVLASVTGQEMETPGEILHVARRSQPSFVATLLSAWEGEGRDLGPGLSHELEQLRVRTAFYRDLRARLASEWRDPVSMKGLEIADRYPEPLMRYMNDLDYWVPEEDRLWGIARWLIEDGWAVHSATFMRQDGGLHLIVSMRRFPEDPYALSYGVELGTLALLGDRIGVPSRTRLPAACAEPLAKNLIMMLMERFEQPFRARDLVDAAVLLDGAPSAAVKACALAVHELALWPEYAELVALLEQTPLEVPRLPGDLRTLSVAAQARRRATAAGGLRQPFNFALTNLQNRMMNGTSGVLSRRAWGLAERRLDARAALRAGLLLFALPVETGRLAERATLYERGGTLWADTPVGSFVLVHGDEIDESALEGAKATGDVGDTEAARVARGGDDGPVEDEPGT